VTQDHAPNAAVLDLERLGALLRRDVYVRRERALEMALWPLRTRSVQPPGLPAVRATRVAGPTSQAVEDGDRKLAPIFSVWSEECTAPTVDAIDACGVELQVLLDLCVCI